MIWGSCDSLMVRGSRLFPMSPRALADRFHLYRGLLFQEDCKQIMNAPKDGEAKKNDRVNISNSAST